MVSAALQMPQREQLILSHQGVARATAVAFAKRNRLPIDDACQDALVALVIAADGFDPARGVQFSTYAVWIIRGALSDAAKKERKHANPFSLVGRQPVVLLDDPTVKPLTCPLPSPEDRFMRRELLEAAQVALRAASAQRGRLAQALALNRAAGSPWTVKQVTKRVAPRTPRRRMYMTDADVLAIARSMV
jgi:RNA polymerase sigma factor (sigma-70 family)